MGAMKSLSRRMVSSRTNATLAISFGISLKVCSAILRLMPYRQVVGETIPALTNRFLIEECRFWSLGKKPCHRHAIDISAICFWSTQL